MDRLFKNANVYFFPRDGFKSSLTLSNIYRRCRTPSQQMSFENIATKEEIAQNEQFLFWSQCFQLCSIIMILYIASFHTYVKMFFQSGLLQIFCMREGVNKGEISKNNTHHNDHISSSFNTMGVLHCVNIVTVEPVEIQHLRMFTNLLK